MPPIVAALLIAAFIIVLFHRDSRKQGEVSGALWLPVLWLVITGSRFVSQWIGLGMPSGGGTDTEGSPIDALYFLTLIITGMCVLFRRRTIVGEILRTNRWLIAFIIYGFLSIMWSDFPFIALKRWIKTLGHPVMALIILTEPDPVNALRTAMKRCAFLMMPLSVLFIKYYPQYGRGFDFFTGTPMNFGITLHKTELGYGCMLFGVFFFWNLLMSRSIEDRRIRREEFALSIGFLWMIGWLLHMSDSKTSLGTLLLGMGTIVLLGLRIIDKRFIGTYVIVGIVIAAGAELSFGVYAQLLELLGRDPTLTDRTNIWADTLALLNDPIFGTGFESFWLGSRRDIMWAKWWFHPTQSHNGYIETYLNLGGIGVILLIGMIISAFRNISLDLLKNFDFACLRLGFLFAILAYNFSEAAFQCTHPVWTVFCIIAISNPRLAGSAVAGHSSRPFPVNSLRHGPIDNGAYRDLRFPTARKKGVSTRSAQLK